MVADVEFQLHPFPGEDFLADGFILPPVQLDVAHGRERVHRQVEAVRPVIKDLQGKITRLDETQRPGVDQAGNHRRIPETERQAVGRAVEQHPRAPGFPLDPLEIAVRLGRDDHVAALRAFRAGRVGGRAEVQDRTVGQVTTVPWPAAEADLDLPHFLDHHIKSPGAEQAFHPLLGILELAGTHDAAADAVGEVILVLHHAVVGGADLDDFLDDLVGRCRKQEASRKEQARGQGDDSSHNSHFFSLQI